MSGEAGANGRNRARPGEEGGSEAGRTSLNYTDAVPSSLLLLPLSRIGRIKMKRTKAPRLAAVVSASRCINPLTHAAMAWGGVASLLAQGMKQSDSQSVC